MYQMFIILFFVVVGGVKLKVNQSFDYIKVDFMYIINIDIKWYVEIWQFK